MSDKPRWRTENDAKLHDWAYAILEELWNSDEYREYLEQHQLSQLTIGVTDLRDGPSGFLLEDAAITAANNLDYGPLADRLDSGRASQKLLSWVADGLKSGRFKAQRKSRRERMSDLQRAARDVPYLVRVLAGGYPEQDSNDVLKKAFALAAARHGVAEQSIANLLTKRGARDRRRL